LLFHKRSLYRYAAVRNGLGPLVMKDNAAAVTEWTNRFYDCMSGLTQYTVGLVQVELSCDP
jgi:hypothetical protein